MVEVRDGAGPDSTLLGEALISLHFLSLMVEVYHSFALSPAVLTGSEGPARDLYSTTNQMAVWLFTDSSGSGRGFRANFTSGVNLGSPGTGTGTVGAQLHLSSSCHLSIVTLTVFILFKQLRVQMASSSVGQEAVSTVTGSATVWLTVLISLMRRTVVSRRFLRRHLLRLWTADLRARFSVFLKVNGSSRLQFQVGPTLLTACADTWDSHFSVYTCQYLGYR